MARPVFYNRMKANGGANWHANGKEGGKSYNMKKIYAIAIVFSLAINTMPALAQSFSWSSFATAGTSYNASNLGNTMAVAATGSTQLSGFPNYQSSNGGYLNVGVDWSNRSSNVKYTITFSKGLAGVIFLLYDVDQGGTWDDKITIAGKLADGTNVYPIITASTYNEVSGSSNNILEGTTDNPSYLNNPSVVSFGGQLVKSFTITYSAGNNSPSNPNAQYIGIGTITYGSVLPVDLISFTAEKRDRSAGLKWEVENMINFSHFEIERSETGNGDFETIGSVPTGGVEKGIFTYTDLNVQNRMSRAYYRIKMVDVDGKFRYSPVMMISFGVVTIDVRPTILAAGQPVRVSLSGAGNTRYDVRLLDAGGRMLQQLKQVNGNVQLETGRLAKGIYIVSVTDGNTQQAYRVSVQ